MGAESVRGWIRACKSCAKAGVSATGVRLTCSLCIVIVVTTTCAAAYAQPTTQNFDVRAWEPSGVTRTDYLDAVERLVRFLSQHQGDSGAIIDPVIDREHQYSTPYYAYAVGTLLDAGRALDLRDSGIAAMEHATACFAGGNDAIPDNHGEFFIAPLTGALDLYREHASSRQVKTWTKRLRTPIASIIESVSSKTNNWRTYAMKGEWLRANADLVDKQSATAFIEDAWLHRTQRERMIADEWSLYQDWNGHPQSHAVEAVGRGNLLALVHAGYDGPSAAEIADAVQRGTSTALMLQSPDGQCPPNGRTDNHVFNDVLYLLTFEVEAERLRAAGDTQKAGEYRRAAALAFTSIQRWQREDDPWDGMYSITKNHFDPADRIGYQPASQVTNYTATVAYHLAEAYHLRVSDIEEQPAPAERGGFAMAMDARFGSVVANAGGMQLFANLEGDFVPKYGVHWTPLGIARFSKVGWDARLGPSDGAYDAESKRGVTFGPEWKQRGAWVRLAEKARDYRGTFTREFAGPNLVRCSILYHSVTGVGGPSFRSEFLLTPDGILATTTSPNTSEFGVTLPLLQNDGRELALDLSDRIVRARYPDAADEQCFLLLNEDAEIESGESIIITYGWLRPIRVTSDSDAIRVFIYPRRTNDPAAAAVLDSFRLTETGFESILGTVHENRYEPRLAFDAADPLPSTLSGGN